MNDAAGYCAQCGAQVDPDTASCPGCGKVLSTSGGAAEVPAPADGLDWEISIPLVTSRFFLYDVAKALFWTFLIFDGIVLTIFAIQGQMDGISQFLEISGWILLGFMMMIAAIAVLIFGNRYPMRFSVTRDGASYVSESRRAKTLNRAAIVVGLLARKPGVAGAGFLGAASSSGGVEWEDIRAVREHPAQRVITLMNSWRAVLRLYCTPENYARVAGLVRSYMPTRTAAQPGPQPVAAQSPSTIPRMALLSLLALAACAAVAACPIDFEPALLLGVLICTSLAIWLPGLSRPVAALALAGTLFIATAILRLGMEVHELIPRSVLKGAPMPSWSLYTKFGSMGSSQWIRFGLSMAGLVLLGALAVTALLGRLHRRPAPGS
jgi:hypothetical protein